MPRRLAHVPRAEARAAIGSIVLGAVLLLMKFGAYFVTGSTAVFADALESIVNVAAAAFALYALNIAHRPADKDHPYGHGKVEFLSAGFEGGMILLAAAIGLGRAVDNLLRGHTLHVSRIPVAVVLMGAALFGNAVAGLFLVRIGRQRSSLTLEADGQHLLTDAASTGVALAAILLVQLRGIPIADPLGAIVVSFYIGWVGLRLLRKSAGGLMDEQDAHDSAVLRRILDSHTGPTAAPPAICSYHKLRHRHTGRYHWVDFHIMVPRHWDVQRGHEVASTIEYEIEQALGEGNATAHIEPCGDADCLICKTATADGDPA